MTPVSISPVQLKHHFFPRIQLQAIPGGKRENQPMINREVAYEPLPNKPKDWQIELKVKLESAEKINPFIYELDVHVIGIFELVAELPPEQGQQLIVVNGLSILYGAVREMVVNLTARSPFGAVLLPTISFTDIFNEVKPADAPAPPEAKPAALT